MTTGQKIHFYRKLNHMTLEELGDKCGVQRSVVAKWEKDLVDIKQSRIVQLAVIFGVLPTALLSDNDSRPQDEVSERIISKISKLSEDDKKRLESIVDAWTEVGE